MSSDFVHLHVHSEYSLLDGFGGINDLVNRAKQHGMDALALTDHGAMYGAIDFYLAARNAGIKPIIGCEVYVAPNSRLEKRAKIDTNPQHLVLLAKDHTGYKNLIKLVTKAHLEGFYYRPRVDKELLAAHADGLICLSACASGEVPRLLLAGDTAGARTAAKWYVDVFGRENYYLELQRHDWEELEAVNRELVAIGRELGVPLVATNDVHYVDPTDANAQELLLCIQTNTTMDDPKRLRMQGQSYYLRSAAEMAALFSELPEALRTTREISERCNLTLDFGRVQLPEFEVPEGFTADTYLEHLCREGLARRYSTVTSEVEERLRYELDVIKQTGFSLYILIVWDIVRYARSRGIPFGPRGSAAGSLVCYLLGISNVDPIANKLVFERFLNIERKEMPDIDMDFADDRRDEMIEYVTQKYGRDHVAQIITFGTLGAKAAIRDAGRAMGLPLPFVDRVAKLVPSLPLHITIEQAMKERPELRELYEEDSAAQQLIDGAKSVEGVTRHASTHAAGVVISREPLVEVVPLQPLARGENGVMTQYHMGALAQVGLLKMDFLGLANLSILRRSLEIIRESRGIDLDLDNLDLEDEKTFAMLGEGETTAVFQLEGPGMRRYIKELRPTNVDDLAAMVALYRPGPMEHIPRYIARKHGTEPIEYPHPSLEPLLRDTYGIIVYQDQVLQIVRAVAGYSLGQADILRKAMGKKIAEIMAKERDQFVARAQQNGLSKDDAARIFAIIEPFAGYAFNRSHAYCYAHVAYQTAYLKANYSVEYMTAVLATAMGNTEKVATAIAECRRLGIAVLGPDVNRSDVGFRIEVVPGDQGESHAIRFGLAAIKNVGESAVEPIVAARQADGPFTSLEDFCRRVDVRALNRRVLESLVKCGAFDGFGKRSQILAVVDRLLSFAQQTQRAQQVGQTSLFDVLPADDRAEAIVLPDRPEVSSKEKLAWEKELIGLYVSDHPLQQAAAELEQVVTHFCDELTEDYVGERVCLAGMVTGVRQLTTKRRETMATLTLEDLRGTVEVVVFPKVYERTKEVWEEDALVVLQGRLDSRDDRLQVICEAAEVYQADQSGEVQIARSASGEHSADREAYDQAAPSDGAFALSQRLRAAATEADGGNGRSRSTSNGTTNGHVNGSRATRRASAAAAAPPSAAEPAMPGTPRRRLVITFRRTADVAEDIQRLTELTSLVNSQAAGNDEVRLAVVGGDQGRVELESPEARIRGDGPFQRQLRRLLGDDAVSVETTE